MVESLPNMHKALDFIPRKRKRIGGEEENGEGRGEREQVTNREGKTKRDFFCC